MTDLHKKGVVLKKANLFMILWIFSLIACTEGKSVRKKPSFDIPKPAPKKREDLAISLTWAPEFNQKSDPDEVVPPYLRPRPSRFSRIMWKRIERSFADVLEVRHHLHAHPELANREIETARYLRDRMQSLGLQIKGPIGLTGFAAILQGDNPGPTVALVAGMEGAPGTETTGLPFASRAWGYWQGRKVRVVHSYGHDMDMATLYGTARVLQSMKKHLKGTVLFIFQPAAVTVPPGEQHGAQSVMASGILVEYKVRALFTVAMDPSIPLGKAGIPAGASQGGFTKFSIVVQGSRGRTCLASVPWKCVDPVAVAAHLVEDLLTLPSRHFGPTRNVILSVGSIHGGEAGHTIASKVVMEGAYRWLVPRDAQKMQELIRRATAGAAKASGTQIAVNFNRGPSMKVASRSLTMWALPTLVRSLGRRGILPGDPLSEPGDFPEYRKQVPTAMFLIGSTRPGTENPAPRGSSSFSPDEEAVTVGMHILSNLVMDYGYTPASK